MKVYDADELRGDVKVLILSELWELLEKKKKTWNSRDDPIRCSVLDWLLAELEEGARK